MRWILCAFAASLLGCAPIGPGSSPPTLDNPGEDPEFEPEPEVSEPQVVPIVLVHGFNAAPGSVWSFDQVSEELTLDGYIVEEVKLPPFASVATRAESLATQINNILEEHDASQVHIIAHSMGGLDARHLISVLGYGPEVMSLTSIGTPHWGTPVADQALSVGSWADGLADSIAKLLAKTYTDFESDPNLRAAMSDMSIENARERNDLLQDDPGVFYQSFGGVASLRGRAYRESEHTICDTRIPEGNELTDRVNVALYGTHAVLTAKDVPGDGLIPLDSTMHGTFRGCLPADHLELIGRGDQEGENTRTGFDHHRFYRQIAAELSELESCAGEFRCSYKGNTAMPTTCRCL